MVALAQETGEGLTTFKPDRVALAARVKRVRHTLAGKAPAFEAGYLFVMEDTAGDDIAGVCGIETEVGLEQPFYNYRVSTVVHASKDMGMWTRMSLLNISHDLTGYSEVCSLFLSPRYRTAGVGGLLSRSHFMFIAQFTERFPQRLCAELRGHFDENGESPFWNAVGSHFYQIDFNEADYLSSHGKKSFVAELMPCYPVYLDLLPDAAKNAVGITHKGTPRPRARCSKRKGYVMRITSISSMRVRCFDAGPVLECHIGDLRTVRESVLATVRIGERASPAERDAISLVSNTLLEDFRCARRPARSKTARSC